MHKKKFIWVLAIVVGVLIAAAIIATVQSRGSQEDSVVTVSTDRPSEELIDDSKYQWKGSATDPKKIVINSINVDAYIQKVGVDQNSQIAVPTNIFLAGWFVESASPGKNGLSIIDGHLNGYTKDGIFINLDKLKAGDLFDVVLGDGKILRYKVFKTVTLDTEASAAELFSQDPKVVSQLNLITCGGNFNESNRQYDKRVIVSAELQ